MLIDSHAHLDMSPFEKDRDAVIRRAREGGVAQIITVGVDINSSHAALELARNYDFIHSTVGFHPHYAKEADEKGLQELARLAAEPEVVAWGEIGLDFFHKHSAPSIQREIFEQQIRMAMDLDLPIIIHDRDAHTETVQMLKGLIGNRTRGVIHCFSGDYALAMRFIDMGFLISIPGTVTYKNATAVQEAASKIPLECLLVETDSPYLTPVPKRGKRNEPLFVTHTVKKIAQLRKMDIEDIARRTSKNAMNLFRLNNTR